MVWTGRYWKKYICPHPLKFSNFFHDNRPDIRYPACRISGRISGTCNRISGRIPDSKKGRISGRISGRPDIRGNPKLIIARVKKNDNRKSTLMKLGMIMDQALSAIFYMTSSNRKGGVSFGWRDVKTIFLHPILGSVCAPGCEIKRWVRNQRWVQGCHQTHPVYAKNNYLFWKKNVDVSHSWRWSLRGVPKLQVAYYTVIFRESF